MRSSAARPEILDHLVDLLLNKYRFGRVKRALAITGISWVSPDFLDHIVDLLLHEYRFGVKRKTRALATTGISAARPEILDRLVDLLLHKNEDVRHSSMYVFQQLSVKGIRIFKTLKEKLKVKSVDELSRLDNDIPH